MSVNPSAVVPPTITPFAYNLPPVIPRLHQAKALMGLTFSDIAKATGKDEVYVAAVMFGQAKASDAVLADIAKVLNFPLEAITAEIGSHWWPQRGLGPTPPSDPVVYRLHEGMHVYGQPIKAVIHEKFGDGIMSMIDCNVTVDRKEDPKGDRVVLTFDGKFLPYSTW